MWVIRPHNVPLGSGPVQRENRFYRAKGNSCVTLLIV
jgi:hypothetical protein